jgi:uncharacterized protein (DUF2236 family)
MSWKLGRETAAALGGGRAALLQLAHPYVAAAVMEHSDTRADPVGRLQRTFAGVFQMTFGDLDHAIHMARRLHRIHTHITGELRAPGGRYRDGERYRANDAESLFWVHATLLDTSILLYELLVEPMSAAEKAQAFDEARRFSWLFGIPDEYIPKDYIGFERYMDAMLASDALSVSPAALHLRRFIFQPPRRTHVPLAAWYTRFTSALMTPRLRRGFELPWGRRDEALFAASVPLLRASYRALPVRLRSFADFVEAERRLAGHPRTDRVGRFVEKVVSKVLEPSPELLVREGAPGGAGGASVCSPDALRPRRDRRWPRR